MSKDWVKDINKMHKKFGVHEAVEKLPLDMLVEFYKLRLRMLGEEQGELVSAESPDEAVDAIIDWIVFGIGTLDLFGVDAHEAWNRVLEANMVKSPGVKEGRPNPFGLPDLIKPEGWTPPCHNDNLGTIQDVFEYTVDK